MARRLLVSKRKAQQPTTTTFFGSCRRRCLLAWILGCLLALFSLGSVWHVHTSVLLTTDTQPRGDEKQAPSTTIRLNKQQPSRRQETKAHADEAPVDLKQSIHWQTRFDHFAPRAIKSSVPYLTSLDDKHRIPPHVLHGGNISRYFEGWTGPDALFTYNPSLVVLSDSTKRRLEREWKLGVRNDPLLFSNNPPLYLATFRFSSIHGCGFKTYNFQTLYRNVFGFALLNANLQPVLDVIVDVTPYWKFYDAFQDARLFQFAFSHRTEDEPQLIWSTGKYLIPIYVSLSKTPLPNARIIPNLYGDTLTISMVGSEVIDTLVEGKNFNYVQAQDGPSNILMEVYPSRPHIMLEFKLQDTLPRGVIASTTDQANDITSIIATITTGNDEADPIPKITRPIKPVQDYVHRHVHMVRPRSLTEDRLLVSLIKRDRGTACCISVSGEFWHDLIPHFLKAHPHIHKDFNFSLTDLPQHLWVGISHTKSHQRLSADGYEQLQLQNAWTGTIGAGYIYLSRWYAIVPYPPYPELVRSNLFCFGFASAGGGDEQQQDPYHNVTANLSRLVIHSKIFDCPRIHFASGLTLHATNKSKAVVGYGINDCVTRFMEVELRDIMLRLFWTLESDPDAF